MTLIPILRSWKCTKHWSPFYKTDSGTNKRVDFFTPDIIMVKESEQNSRFIRLCAFPEPYHVLKLMDHRRRDVYVQFHPNPLMGVKRRTNLEGDQKKTPVPCKTIFITIKNRGGTLWPSKKTVEDAVTTKNGVWTINTSKECPPSPPSTYYLTLWGNRTYSGSRILLDFLGRPRGHSGPRRFWVTNDCSFVSPFRPRASSLLP